MQEFKRLLVPVFLCTERELTLIPYTDKNVFTIDIPALTRGDRIKLWQYYSAVDSIEGLYCVVLGSRYTLNIGES